MIVLDCTFRDGGYKTGWRFDADEVKRHIAGTAADVASQVVHPVPSSQTSGHAWEDKPVITADSSPSGIRARYPVAYLEGIPFSRVRMIKVVAK